MFLRTIGYEGERDFKEINRRANLYLDKLEEERKLPPIQSVIYNLFALFSDEMEEKKPDEARLNVILDTIELAEYSEEIILVNNLN